MTQVYKLKSSVREPPGADNLFWGIWIRWRAMKVAERFVCANIVLVPIWWVIGLYQYMTLLLLLGVAVYELWQYGKLRLKLPNLPVVALFAFGTYQLARLFISRLLFNTAIGKVPEEALLLALCPACLLWYIQSKNIRIRMMVVAWAFTVSVVQMLGFWLLIQFVLPKSIFIPPRLYNLFALLTGQTGAEDLSANIFALVPYVPYGNLAGLPRFSFFFIFPEFLAVVAGFIGLVALEIKNRLWSSLLFLGCVFLIFLSGTRIVWLAFPIVVGLRYLFINFGNRWVPPIIFSLIAVASFTTFSLPPATDLFLNTFTESAQSVDKVRADSTEIRMEIYRRTWKGIEENPMWGYGIAGPPVNPYLKFTRVGSHSFILGRLLYRSGLVGTLTFIVFWISLFIWLYETRAGRPLTCFCVLIFYTLISPSLELVYEMPLSSLIILLCAAIRYGSKQLPSPQTKISSRSKSCVSS